MDAPGEEWKDDRESAEGFRDHRDEDARAAGDGKASDLENFLDEKLAAGLAPRTVNQLRGYVSRAFTTARRKGWWTGVNPVTDVQRKPVPSGVVGDNLRVEKVPVVLEQLARR